MGDVRKRTLTAGALALVAVMAAGALLPKGLPLGVVLFGLLLGALSSLTAMGLVLIYRSARIINFAQAEIGGLAASVAVVLVVGQHQSYWLALPVGLGVSLATGALVDLVVMRRLFTTPRLIVTVATIGLAQVLGAGELALPTLYSHLRPFTTFTTPFHFTHRVPPFLFTGDAVVAGVTVVAVLVLLAVFLSRSILGLAIRGSADSADRAELLGIPVRRLSTVTWIVAGGMSGIGSMLTAPVLGPQLGVIAGPIALLAPLTAAILGGMDSLTIAFGASLAIGVFQQAVYWSYPHATTVDVALFIVVLAGMLAQRRRSTRTDDSGLGGYIAVQEVRRIPEALRRLPEVVWARRALVGAAIVSAIVVPVVVNDSRRTLLAYVAIFGIIAVSLVVLTGWSGQISLGQFAFAGVGAATTASLYVHAHADLFLSLAAAAVIGALTAVLVGIPAVRLSGLYLAAATMAFAVPVSTFLLSSTYFPGLNPARIARPAVLRRFDLNSALTFSWFCSAFLVLALVVAANYRRSRAGRVALAVRDNARGAAAFGISPVRVRLVAFAFAGALAGVGGGLYTLALKGVGYAGFNPELSFQVFAMVVVGGLGSLLGGVLGAFYVYGAQFFLHGAMQLLATGAGILVVVLALPGGLANVLYRGRDRLLRAIAHKRGMSIPSLAESAAFEAAPAPASPHGLLLLDSIEASYGTVPVLFGVNLAVDDCEIVGLLGTNGAGKSTALRVAAGLLAARRGRVTYDGADITTMSAVDRVRRGLVMVPSGRTVFASLTVAENLRLGGWLTRRDRQTTATRVESVLDLFPSLRDRLVTPAASLSGGEQQMLTIAQALLCAPRLLMIDELSLGLAPAVVAQLLAVVRTLAATGVTVIVVEQSLNVATSVAGRSVFMERGQVRFTGATAELASRGDLLRSVFLGSSPARPVRRSRGRAADGPAAFAVHRISRTFGAVKALDDVNLEARPGEILGIIGANGAGKTTLFDICSGFLAATAGRVVLNGTEVTDEPPYVRADLGLGRVFQDARLFPSLSVWETIAVAFERHIETRDPFLSVLRTGVIIDAETDVATKVEGLIARFRLERYRDAFVSELSTGTRRVVELACVLAHNPSVLLLDEPTSGIAQREGEALGQLLLDLRDDSGATFVIIEHDVPLVSSISDRLICLHLGQVIAEGTPADVLADPAVIAAYLGDDQAAIFRSNTARPRRARRPRPLQPAARGG